MTLETFVRGLPKAELHVHIEGTLEPEMMFALAERNDVDLHFDTIDDVRAAYAFTNLQSFLDIYYRGASVLLTEQDFYDLMWAYLVRASADGVRRAEIFFDPQTHIEQGIEFGVFMAGFGRAIEDAARDLGISAGLIMCYLRHLPAEAAIATWDASAPYRNQIIGVGLDSAEVDHPPEEFAELYRLARDAGLRLVAHAGEEGPPAYITGALDVLGVERIDHGVRCEDDPVLVARLADEGIPLTMCPLSNVSLRVYDRLEEHSLKRLLEQGVKVTINSDDPAYFGGYIGANYIAAAEALDLDRDALVQLASNSIEASFLDDAGKQDLLSELAAYAVGSEAAPG